MPRDWRRTAPRTPAAEAPSGTEGQRPCSRGIWCSARTVTVVDGERVINPALGYQAFCLKDEALIRGCLRDLPGLWLRLQYELAEPVAAETSVHVPFGPSIPVRLDVDAAMRMTAFLLRTWQRRVATAARTTQPAGSPLTAEGVRDAAAALGRNLTALLALQPGWVTHNAPLHPGRRHGTQARGAQAECRRCGRRITHSALSGDWWAADSAVTAMGSTTTLPRPRCKHAPAEGTVMLPQPSPVSEAVLEAYGDDEIVRVGADFIGVFIQRDGAAAGLEILHLHYWDRAVLRETPPRPEELLGVECRSCSLLALRRAEPPWHKGDPEYYSECAECGDLMSEDDYRLWVGQLHAYQKARLAAMPTLGTPPAA